MTAVYSTPTSESVKRLADAEQMGKLAGAEYRNLVDDLSWDPENWQRLIEQIQVNPYEPDECDEPLSEAERLTPHKRWKGAFDQGQHAQQAENRRGRA